MSGYSLAWTKPLRPTHRRILHWRIITRPVEYNGQLHASFYEVPGFDRDPETGDLVFRSPEGAPPRLRWAIVDRIVPIQVEVPLCRN